MTIQDLGSVGELIAAIATVVTLLYLSIQIRHNSRIAAAESQRDLLNTYSFHHAILADPELPSVVRRGFESFSKLSKDDQARFHLALHPLSNHVEACFRMWRGGYIEAASYKGFRDGLLSVISTEGGKEWWQFDRKNLGADFEEAIDEALVSEGDRIVPLTVLQPRQRARRLPLAGRTR